MPILTKNACSVYIDLKKSKFYLFEVQFWYVFGGGIIPASKH
jgi:hypothetical protein